MDLSFSTESLNENKEKPTFLDNIFKGKPIKVSASFVRDINIIKYFNFNFRVLSEKKTKNKKI